MINPYSTLPSFLEMVFIQQADTSTRQAMQTGMQSLQHILRRYSSYSSAGTAANSPQETSGDKNNNSNNIQEATILNAFRSVWKKISVLWPKRMARVFAAILQKYPAEIQCLAVYLLERRCLSSTTTATMSESIYGGRRVKVVERQRQRPQHLPAGGNASTPPSRSSVKSLEPLSTADQTRLALVLALGPYLRTKLDAIHRLWSQRRVSFRTNFDWKTRRFFLMAYPWVRASLQGANWVCQWRFLLGHSAFFNLPSLLLRQVVRRVTQEDKKAAAPPASSEPSTTTTAAAQDGASAVLARSAVTAVASALAVSWLTQMRVAWQHYHRQQRENQQQQQQRRRRLAASTTSSSSQEDDGGVVPPPPEPRHKQQQHGGGGGGFEPFLRLPPKDKSLCPLCRQRRILPTASTSGFVFCFDCLLQHLRRGRGGAHATCPITGRPCPESRMVRLYEPAAAAEATSTAASSPSVTPQRHS